MSSVDEEMGRGGDVWDAPNQQVVREDASGPWEEGTGGEPGETAEPEPEPAAEPQPEPEPEPAAEPEPEPDGA